MEKKLKYRSIGDKVDKHIARYCNHILDSFADNEMSNHQKYYGILKDLRLEDLEKPYPNNNEINIDLCLYFLYYIQLNYLLKNEEKKAMKDKIIEFLRNIEELIMKKDSKLTIDKLNQLKNILDKFNEMKQALELQELKNFIFEVINSLQYYDKSYIEEQLNMIFSTDF